MSNLYRLVGFALLGLLLASCSAQKRVWYLQDVQPATPEQIVQNGEIRIKPLDRLIVVVNSKDPELAVPFNSSTAMSSLSGSSTTSTNSIESLQTRTVDENGCILMPIIGTVKCEGLTRNELARLIADKIVEGGYINDPSVNVQFSDMKFSVIGEVAHPGSFEIDRDRISILDALAMAGDMTVYGMRNEVIVARGRRQTDHRGTRSHLERCLQLPGLLPPAERRRIRQAQQVQGPVGRDQPEPKLLSLARQHGDLRHYAHRLHHLPRQINSDHDRTATEQHTPTSL